MTDSPQRFPHEDRARCPADLQRQGQQPLASIVINNHNYGSFLGDAIASALGQSYRNIEVIVVDDGSTDDSHEIIHSFGERIIPILQDNRGQASTFNAGITRLRGDVVIFLDADDMLLPEIVRRVCDTFSAQSDLVRIQYRMEVIDGAGRRTGVLKPFPHLPRLSGDLRQHILRFPDDTTRMATSGNAFAAWVLREVFPLPEHIYGAVGADWYLNHLTPLFGPVAFLDDIGAYYRVHGANSYEHVRPALDMAHVRQTMLYSSTTHAYMKEYAQRLGLISATSRDALPISLSLLAHRLISLRLDSSKHPFKEDSIRNLLRSGVRTSLRRMDVAPPLRLFFLLWFAAMAYAPRPLARWLAVRFLFPETRQRFNQLLRLLHRNRPITDGSSDTSNHGD